MNYETEIKLRREAGDTPQQIADAINVDRLADAENYTPLDPPRMSRLLMSNGLKTRIEIWGQDQLALAVGDRDPHFIQLKSGFDGLVIGANGTSHRMSGAPGSPDRQLIELAVSKGILTAADLAVLAALSFVGDTETAETVQAAIVEHDKSRVFDQFNNESAAATAAAVGAINSGGDVAAAWAAFNAERV